MGTLGGKSKRATLGAHLTNFPFEFFYDIFTEDASLLFLYHSGKKSKMTKNSNQGILRSVIGFLLRGGGGGLDTISPLSFGFRSPKSCLDWAKVDNDTRERSFDKERWNFGSDWQRCWLREGNRLLGGENAGARKRIKKSKFGVVKICEGRHL